MLAFKRTLFLLPAALLVAAMSVPSAALAAPTPGEGPSSSPTDDVTDVLETPDIIGLAGGGSHTLILRSDRAFGSGDDSAGQLGNGGSGSSLTPSQVLSPAGVTFTSVAAGMSHSLAIGDDGKTYAWGLNLNGQLGNSNSAVFFSQTPIEVAVPATVNFTKIVAGKVASYALGDDGRVYAWGSAADGKLGNGTTSPDSFAPVPVSLPPGVASFTDLAAGEDNGYALGSNGRLYAWGLDSSGALGDGAATGTKTTPVEVAGQPFAGGAIEEIAAGKDFAAVRLADGTVMSWGANGLGQLGNGNNTDQPAPVPVTSGGVAFSQLKANGQHVYGLTTSGALYAWGRGAEGQLGRGSTAASNVPVAATMPAGVSFTLVTAGGADPLAAGNAPGFGLAVGDDGLLYSWGNAGSGQLANGANTPNVLVPTKVPQTPTISAVTFGGVAGLNPTYVDATQSWQVDAHPGSTDPRCGLVEVVVNYQLWGVTGSVEYDDGFRFGSEVVINEQPASAKLKTDETVVLEATGSGDDAPTVQWQFAAPGSNDWEDLAGATDTTYETGQLGNYRAVFTNCNGSVASSIAEISREVPSTLTHEDDPKQVTKELSSTGSDGLESAVWPGVLMLFFGGASVGLISYRRQHALARRVSAERV